MTKQDVDQLFKLLEIYRPGDKRLGDKTLKSAWLLVLEPYEPSDVKQALASYFRENKFLPDVSDIAMRCPKTIQAGPAEGNGGTVRTRHQEELEQMLDDLEMGSLMDLDYVSVGVPHPDEARRLGWSVKEWNERCTLALGLEAGAMRRKINLESNGGVNNGADTEVEPVRGKAPGPRRAGPEVYRGAGEPA